MQKSDYKNMWVYVEHDGKTAAPVSLELCCELRKLCVAPGVLKPLGAEPHHLRRDAAEAAQKRDHEISLGGGGIES